MTCYRQTCTQIITGRNLNYRRALKVVQNEEYLSAIDLSDVKRNKRKKRQKVLPTSMSSTSVQNIQIDTSSTMDNISADSISKLNINQVDCTQKSANKKTFLLTF